MKRIWFQKQIIIEILSLMSTLMQSVATPESKRPTLRTYLKLL